MSFQQDIAEVVNRYGMEGGSNTPDYVLAQFLAECMGAFNSAVRLRSEHAGKVEVLPVDEEVDKWVRIANDRSQEASMWRCKQIEAEALCDRLGEALVAADRWVNQPCAVKAEVEKAITAWKEARK